MCHLAPRPTYSQTDGPTSNLTLYAILAHSLQLRAVYSKTTRGICGSGDWARVAVGMHAAWLCQITLLRWCGGRSQPRLYRDLHLGRWPLLGPSAWAVLVRGADISFEIIRFHDEVAPEHTARHRCQIDLRFFFYIFSSQYISRFSAFDHTFT